MSETRGPVRLFATLLLFWVLLNASLAPAVLVVGVVVAGIAVLVSKGALSFLSGLNLSPAGLGATASFLVFFLKELVVANLRMASLVLRPSLPIAPAIVRTRTSLTHPVARIALANAITLTPGTLTVEMKDEWLWIHWVVAESTDTEAATDAIVRGFERYLEKMYG